MRYVKQLFIFAWMLMEIPAMACGKTRITINTQEDFDRMTASIEKTLEEGARQIEVVIGSGTFYFRNDQLRLDGKKYKNVKLRVLGKGTVIMSKGADYVDGSAYTGQFRVDNAVVAGGSLVPVWSDVMEAEGAVEVVPNFVYEYTHQRMPGIVSNVLSALDWYSYLQYYNTDMITSVNADGILFKGLKISKLYDGVNAIDCTTCLDVVRNHGNNASLPHYPSEVDLRDFRSRKVTSDVFNLHRGHDVMHCMAIVIRNNTYPGGKMIGNDDVARELRISYQFDDFQSTLLYQKLDAWMTSTGHHLWN